MALDAGSVEATLRAKVDDRGFTDFDRELTRRDKAGATASLGAEVDKAGFAEFDRAVARAGTRRATAELNVDADHAAIQRFEQRVRSTGSAVSNLNQQGQFLSRTLGLIKWPAFITAVGGAAQAAGALTGGVVGLSSALAPLSGLLAGYPALLGAFGQTAGVVALAGIDDLSSAVGGLNEKLDRQSTEFKKLSPQAQKFAEVLQRYKAPIRELQSAVQRPLFEGLAKGAEDARGVLDPLRRGLRGTAGVLGDLAAQAGRLVGSRGFGRDFSKIMAGNNRLIENLGKSGIRLGSALRHVMVAAQPLVRWMGELSLEWSKSIEGAAEAGRESGRLAGFFDRTRSTAEQLFRIIGSLAGAFGDIGRAARPLGEDVLDYFERAADSFERWTSSARGQNELASYFERVRAPLFEMFRLLGDAGKAFFELGETPGLTRLIRQIRTVLLPAFVDLTQETTRAFGPVLIDGIVEFGRLLGHLMGTSGPLNAFVRIFTGAARALNTLIDEVPVLGNAIVTALGGLSIAKLLGLGALKNGLRAAIVGGVTSGVDATASSSGTLRGRMLGLGKAVLGGALALGTLSGLGAALSSRSGAGWGALEAGANDFIVGFGRTFGLNLGQTSAEHWAEAFSTEMNVQAKALGGTVSAGFEGEFTSIAPKLAARYSSALKLNFDRRDPAEIFGDFWDRANAEEREQMERLAGTINAAGRLLAKTGIRLPKDFITGAPEAAEEFSRRFVDGLERLRSGALASWADIREVYRRNQETIANTPGLNGKALHEVMASNMREAANALDQAMKNGLIPRTKENLERVEDLIRRARIVNASEGQARRIALGWGRELEALPKITAKNIDGVIGQIKKMPGPVRQEAAEAVLAMLAKFREAGKLSKREFDKVRSALVTSLGRAEAPAGRAADSVVDILVGKFSGLRDALSDILYEIGDIVEDALAKASQMPTKSSATGTKYTPPGGARGGLVTENGIQRFARGGAARAVAGQDTVPARLMPGEYVLPAQMAALMGLTGSGGGGLMALLAMLMGGGRAGVVPGTPQRISSPAATVARPAVQRGSTPPPPVVGRASAARGGTGGGGGQPTGGTAPRAGAKRGGGSPFSAGVEAVLAAGDVDKQVTEAQRLRESISGTYDELAKIAPAHAEELAKRVGDHLGYLTQSGSKRAREFADKFGIEMKGLRDNAQKVSRSMRDAVVTELGTLRDRGTDQIGTLASKLSEKWDGMREKARKSSGDLAGDVTGNFRELPSKAEEVFGNVTTKIKNKLDGANVGPKANSAYRDPLVNAASEAGTSVEDKVGAMLTEIDKASDALDALAKQAKNTPSKPSGGKGGGGKARFGGPVPGIGYGDSVPMLLDPREYVLSPEAVQALGGYKVLDRLNAIRARGGGGVADLMRKKGKKKPKPPWWAKQGLAATLSSDQLALLEGNEYATWSDPDTVPLELAMAGFTGTGTEHAVSSLWTGAFAGVGDLFNTLFSAIGVNNEGWAQGIEASILGAGGQSILAGAQALLGQIGGMGANLISSADPNNPSSPLGLLLAGMRGQRDTTAGLLGSALGTTTGAIANITGNARKMTQEDRAAYRALAKQANDLANKKPKGWKKKVQALNAQMKAIKTGATLAPSELAALEGLRSQESELKRMDAEDLDAFGLATLDAINAGASFQETVRGMLEGFGSTDPSRARSSYLAALDAGFGEIRNFQSSRGSLASEFGSNFLGGGGAAAYGSARTFGAEGSGASGVVQSGADGRPIMLNNYFQSAPSDPHTWSRNALFEIRAAVG